jgi:hypothetical protein
MKVGDEYYIQKKNFVEKLSELLKIAKPHLACVYKLGEEIGKDHGCEYVVVTASNGYPYVVNVSCDSLTAIAAEVFQAMIGK